WGILHLVVAQSDAGYPNFFCRSFLFHFDRAGSSMVACRTGFEPPPLEFSFCFFVSFKPIRYVHGQHPQCSAREALYSHKISAAQVRAMRPLLGLCVMFWGHSSTSNAVQRATSSGQWRTLSQTLSRSCPITSAKCSSPSVVSDSLLPQVHTTAPKEAFSIPGHPRLARRSKQSSSPPTGHPVPSPSRLTSHHTSQWTPPPPSSPTSSNTSSTPSPTTNRTPYT
ncbi:hypothetical protein QBC34DRAFT_479759, partial [Podospora aff. communis PSN243]